MLRAMILLAIKKEEEKKNPLPVLKIEVLLF